MKSNLEFYINPKDIKKEDEKETEDSATNEEILNLADVMGIKPEIKEEIIGESLFDDEVPIKEKAENLTDFIKEEDSIEDTSSAQECSLIRQTGNREEPHPMGAETTNATHTTEKKLDATPLEESSFFPNSTQLEDNKTGDEKINPECEFCKKKFRNLSLLQRHKRSHTKENPYCCHQCNKFFRHKYSLKIHTNTHTNGKPYSCDICSKAFSYKNTLYAHKKRHKQTRGKCFKCEECGKTFVQERSLRHHTLSHSIEKPYHCDICSKSYIYKHHLNIHKRKHLGGNPYACKVCGREFATIFSAKRHLKVHKDMAVDDYNSLIEKRPQK